MLDSGRAVDSGAGAVGAHAPIDDFSFVDFVAEVIGRGQAGRGAHGTVDVDHGVAPATYEMVVVVGHPVLVAGRRAAGLNASQQALVGEGAKHVVNRLTGDGPQLRSRLGVQLVGTRVGPMGHRLHYGQSLGGDLETVLPEQLAVGPLVHTGTIVEYWTQSNLVGHIGAARASR